MEITVAIVEEVMNWAKSQVASQLMPWIVAAKSMMPVMTATVCTPAKAASASKTYSDVHLSKEIDAVCFLSQNFVDMRDLYTCMHRMSEALHAMAS